MIRAATISDVDAICRLYNRFVEESIVTFEEQPVAADEMRDRMVRVREHFPWYVREDGGDIVGYAYAAPWQTRSAYRYSVETTVYVEPGRQRAGIGTQLYEKLLARLTEQGTRCAIGGIALPNDASVALHERLGFRKVAHFEAVGFKLGRWLDVGYWQRQLQHPEFGDSDPNSAPIWGQ